MRLLSIGCTLALACVLASIASADDPADPVPIAHDYLVELEDLCVGMLGDEARCPSLLRVWETDAAPSVRDRTCEDVDELAGACADRFGADHGTCWELDLVAQDACSEAVGAPLPPPPDMSAEAYRRWLRKMRRRCFHAHHRDPGGGDADTDVDVDTDIDTDVDADLPHRPCPRPPPPPRPKPVPVPAPE